MKKCKAIVDAAGEASAGGQKGFFGFLEIYFVLIVIWFGRGMVMAVESSTTVQKSIDLRALRRPLVRSCSAKVVCMEPLLEGPSHDLCDPLSNEATKESRWKLGRNWIPRRRQNCSDLKLLLGVFGCPLAPVAVLSAHPPLPISLQNVPIETSSAQYIVQQYIAATGCANIHSSVKSSYTMGKLKMLATEYETATKLSKNVSKCAESGCFVLWQLTPDMWLMELVVGSNKIHAGSNGNIVWRQTPWLGSHAAKGPARPLRRAIQGLDPRTTASMFLNARCVGEKRIGEEECFTLKLVASPSVLAERSDGPAEIIRHVLFGYFSQRSGLLVCMEDSHLTRIESTGGDSVYWETTTETTIHDYKRVDGVMIAHAGRSVVTVFTFGAQIGMTYAKTRMEETWVIEEIVFNVPGLSMDCFIPPADVKKGSDIEDPGELKLDKFGNGNAWQTCLKQLK
ncbi:uncharacterized protein LOC131060723 [Cryptomeria japonica]|uniref:uncharacterized protein LOC131060723 n=1 Tax=Cryptomeria japonica TaxID=3369 RepID=UPI0027D9EF67|nr:uncharacterized protein LOC131060723 [Cryptomeria japonica]